MTRLAAAVALVLTAVPGLATAQDYGCETRRPSDPPCAPPEARPIVIDAEPEEEPEVVRRGAPRIHGALLDTGHLLEPGTFQFSGRVYGTLSQLAVGLHERLELSSDLIGFGLVGASAGFRASLTDAESPFRALVGAKLWTLTGSAMKPVQLFGTVAYQGERFNLHGNLLEMPTEGGRVWVAAIGAVYEVTEVVSLTADAGRIEVGPDELVEGAIAGVKLTGEKFDLDLTVAVNDEGALPLVGLTGRI